MIELLDKALDAATGEITLSRVEVMRLLDLMYERAAFIETRYYYVIRNENGAEAWKRHGDKINHHQF